jgi:hypothetical protein
MNTKEYKPSDVLRQAYVNFEKAEDKLAQQLLKPMKRHMKKSKYWKGNK